MTEPTPSSSSAANELRLFPSAAQPNIIRAYEKDEVYLQYLAECCHDAVRRLLGPRQALLWARETKLLAELLYYALTTGAGRQTLGEEYCDVLQVTGRIGVPPGPLQRGVLVLLQALGPYLAERVSAPQDEGFAAWQAARGQGEAQLGAAGGAAGRLAGLRQMARSLGAWGERVLEQAQRALAPGAAGQAGAWARFLWEHSGTLLRLHLALFYLYGVYFQPSKRVTGVRYIFAGRSFEQRPSYHILGLLLLLQLGVSGALWAARSAGGAGGGVRLGPLRLGGGPQAAAKPRYAVLLEADGSELQEEAEGGALEVIEGAGEEATTPAAAAAAAAAQSARKCPLCLSPRDHPTATPCGHVFCWRCIAEWVSQKPECPLCRSDVTTSSLVCVRHADF